MTDPEATLCFVVSPGRYTASMRYRPETDGDLNITAQDGKLIKSTTFRANVFAETMFTFSVPTEQRCLRLSAQMGKLPDSKRLLLFTKIALEKQP
jgi:hypothetical protein